MNHHISSPIRRRTLLSRMAILCLLAVLLLASCGRNVVPTVPEPEPEPVPPVVAAVTALGEVRLAVQADSSGELQVQGSSAATTGLTFGSSPVSKGFIDQGGVRYLYAVFEATNRGATSLSNVDLFAAYVDSPDQRNLAGTAVADLRDASGQSLDDPAFARSIRPMHRMQDDNGVLSVKQDEADFQAFTPAQVAAAQAHSPAFTQLLEYGYSLRSEQGSRTIEPGGKGYVSFAIRFPYHPEGFAPSPYSFVLTYQAFTTPLNQVSRSPEEGPDTAAACQRAAARSATQVVVLGEPGTAPSACPVLALQDVKIAQAVGALPALYLLSLGADTTAPAAPSGLTAAAGDAQITLTWNVHPEADVAGYALYRNGTEVYRGRAATFIDTGLVNDTVYVYTLKAFDTAGNVSPASAPVSATPVANTVVGTKVNFQSEGAPVPAGYLKDFGQPYGLRSGADQGGSRFSYGWVKESDPATSLDLSANGVDRNRAGVDQRVDTVMQMQATVAGLSQVPGAWQISVPNGVYRVTVSVGDAPSSKGYDSLNAVNIEGGVLIEKFQAVSTQEYFTVSALIGVNDGKLILDARGGSNTKLNYVDIVSQPLAPFVTEINPQNRAASHGLEDGVAAGVFVPGNGVGVAPATLQGNVRLVKVSTNTEVAGSTGSTGGNDAITFAPAHPLEPATQYRFTISSGVKSEAGESFLPFTSVFTTGSSAITSQGTFTPVSGVAFDRVELPIADGKYFTTLQVYGGKLYAAMNTGQIKRYTVNPDGTLSGEETLKGVTSSAAPGFPSNPRLLIGMVFDPASTPENPVAWVTHSQFGFDNVANRWAGKVSRLSGPNLENLQDVFVGLPRSLKDHVTNSITFGPDGNLYFAQGSNLAAGQPDSSWGDRPETLLTAAILTFNPSEVLRRSLPIDVKTSETWTDGVTGTYNPFAADAPLKIYGTGVRNAYDLLWHSNGHLYVPTNGTASGGNSPSVSASALPTACSTARVDAGEKGAYTGPSVTGVTGHETQRDFLFDVVKNGYYGHPNPSRCEWILNGGNLTSSTTDPGEGYLGSKYPVGTQPDRNYRGFAYDFEFNKSPDGVIEYQSPTFGGALQGRMLVVRFSNNNDILTMQVDASGKVLGAQSGTTIPGFEGFDDPLDLVEDTTDGRGNLYVSQYDRDGVNQKLWLLRPRVSAGQ